MDLLPDTYSYALRMHRECRERHLRDARAVMYARIANQQWWGKHSRHSRRMRNPQFYESGNGPMEGSELWSKALPTTYYYYHDNWVVQAMLYPPPPPPPPPPNI